mgnify:CR=1 FL=1
MPFLNNMTKTTTTTQSKFVINTQYMENYGAHTWDGEHQCECPQHWKPKGGNTYVILDETIFNSPKSLFDIANAIVHKDDYSEVLILSTEEMPVDIVVCKEWESVRKIYRTEEGTYRYVEVTDNDDGDMRHDIKRKTVDIGLDGAEPKTTYEMVDGRLLDYNEMLTMLVADHPRNIGTQI